MFHGSVLKWSAPVRLKLPNSWTQRSEYMRSLHCCCLYLPTLYLKILVSNIHFYKHKMYKTCKANEIASSYHCFLWWLPMVEEGRFFFCPSKNYFKLCFWSQMCCTETWFGANISVHWKNLNTDAMVLIKSEMQILSHSFLNFLEQGWWSWWY